MVLVGLFSFYPEANASFLDKFAGNKVSAETLEENASKSLENSQNMGLLKPSISFLASLGDKNKTDLSTEEKTGMVSDNALVPIPANDILVSPEEEQIGNAYSEQINVYVVRKNDSISQIAEMFGVSSNTILWANDLKKDSPIKEGDVLLILPISGIEHTVLKGQTLKGIAQLYKADIADIARFNGINEESELVIGEKIIIPDGEIYNENSSDTKTTPVKTPPKKTLNIDTPGYFINPVPEFSRRSQGSHGPGRRGVDLAAPTGTRVLASASGKVSFASYGWNGAYGNLVIIQHDNGTKTLYAHLSKILVQKGARVSQGDLVGLVGSTGRSTGPHLHFEVFNAKNPGGTTPMSFAKMK